MGNVNKNVEIIDKAVVKSIEKKDNYFLVCYILDGKEHIISGRYIVGGDGSKSLVRKTFFPDQSIRKYVCIQEWYRTEEKSSCYMTIFDQEITDSYGWLNYKGAYKIFGAAFPILNSKVLFQKLKDKMIREGHIFGELIDREVCQVSSPRSVRELCYGNGNIFLIGEAAGFVSPSSLEGISYALESGHLLAEVFNKGNASDRYYRNSLKPLRRKLFVKILKNKLLYTPIIRKWLMLSNISTIKINKS